MADAAPDGSQASMRKQPSANHIHRPTFLRTLDLKALPTNDSLTNSSPSETQKRRDKYLFFEKQCSKITEGLYLSGDVVAQNWELLQENSITHVINCVGFICKEYFKDKGLKYRTYFLQDTPAEDILSVLYDAFEFIDSAISAGGCVLVHCSQGVSRSATIVIGYYMWKTGSTYDESIATVKLARGIANPNIGFCCQLLQWQKRRTPKAAMRVRLYRISPHCQHNPTQLVPKVVVPPKQYPNNTFRDLDPRGAFIIQSPEKMYVWVGAFCPTTFAASAEYHAKLYPKYEAVNAGHTKPVVVVNQNDEPDEFIDLMDPPLLNADQQRINARRNSITGDLLAGTSGLVGFSSLGLALGSTSNSSTPRSGSPARDPFRVGGGNRAGGGADAAAGPAAGGSASEPMDICDSDGSSSSRGGRRGVGTPPNMFASGVSPAQHNQSIPSRLQVSSTRGADGMGDNDAAACTTLDMCMLDAAMMEEEGMGTYSQWWIDEVEAYSADYNIYAEAVRQALGGTGSSQSLMPIHSLGAREFNSVVVPRRGMQGMGHDESYGNISNSRRGSGMLSESPNPSNMKKYRRSDCGGQLDTYQRMTVDAQKNLSVSLDDEEFSEY